MQYSKFKDLQVSKLGFGTMRLPMLKDGSIDKDETKKMVKVAMENGVNYYDTAWGYHAGKSEEVMGEVLADYPRESYLLATKMPTWLCKSKQDVIDTFQKQLDHLRTDYFDFYLIHSIDDDEWPNIENIQCFSALLEEKAAGRIKHLGASFHCSLDLLDKILETYGSVLEFVQLQINYHDWDFAQGKELHELALKYGKPIVIMEPLRGGMLAKNGDPRLAFKFCSELENVFVTLSGMSTMEALEDNLKTFDSPDLTEAEYEEIWAHAAKLKNDLLIPCTACNYCYDCPSKIKISQIFEAYNESASKAFHEIWGKIYGPYDKLKRDSDPCIECGKCESICPQHIKIIQTLKDVEKKYDEFR
ncbi:MAG: aldo/keto reductase [Clostridia bacterium]|nr:aldo/keto reductase [Clostridia bacterium]